MYTTNILALLSIFSIALGQESSAPLALEVLPAASLNLLPDMGTSMPMLPSASTTATTVMDNSMAEFSMSTTMTTSMPTTAMSSMPTSVSMPMDPSVTAMSSMVTSVAVGTGGVPIMSAGGGGNMSMTLPTLKGSSTMSGSAKPSGSGPSVASNGGQEVESSIKTVMLVLAGVAGLFVLA